MLSRMQDDDDLEQLPATQEDNTEKAELIGFFEKAHKALVVSLCTAEFSGCHTFGNMLSKQLCSEHIKATFVGTISKTSDIKFSKDKNPKEDKNYNHKTVIFTGCAFSEMGVVLKKANNYQINLNGQKIFVFPPHIEYKFQEQKASLTHLYSGEVFSSGINSILGNIGLPPLPNENELECKADKNYYGLVYASYYLRLISKDDMDDDYKLFENYINQVGIAAKGKTKPIIMLISDGLSSDHIETITNLVNEKGVAIEFVNRLSHGDFLKHMKNVAKNKGIVLCDGAYTLREAITLGAKPLVSSCLANNRRYWQQLIATLPKEYQSDAEIIFGKSDNFKALDHRIWEGIVKSLQAEFQQAEARFLSNQSMFQPQNSKMDQSSASNQMVLK